MEVANFDGFSIREYASKMRSVDVVKCWPFGGVSSSSRRQLGEDQEDETIKKEDVEAMLPPITVTKFRWWSHLLNQENNSHKLTSDQPVDTVADQEQPPSPPPPPPPQRKARAPKKRSIVEIFAVAPQIQSVVDDLDLDLDTSQEDEEDKKCCKTLRISKIAFKNKKKNKIVIKNNPTTHVLDKFKKSKIIKIKKKNLLISNTKMKIKKKKKQSDGSIANKEKISRLKMQKPVSLTRSLDGSLYSKNVNKDILDSDSIHKKKPSVKCLSTLKNQKTIRQSKLIAKRQKPMFPVRGILKNHLEDIIIREDIATTSKIEAGSQLNSCGVQHSGKRVRFSGKDGTVLGAKERKFSSFECPKSPNLFSDASEKDLSTESDDVLVTLGLNGSDDDEDDDASISTEDGTKVHSLTEKKQLPNVCDHVDMPNFMRPMCQEKAMHLSEKFVSSSSQVTMHEDNLPMFCHSASPILGTNAPSASTLNEKLTNHFPDSSFGVASMSSMPSAREFSQPLSSFFSLNGNANERLAFMPQANSGSANGTRAWPYKPACCPPPTEVFCSFGPSPEWKQRAIVIGESCRNDNLVGLPLNSHGELIQASSSNRVESYGLKKPTMITGPSSCLPVHNFALPRSTADYLGLKETNCVEIALPGNQLNLFPVPNYISENPNVDLPTRLGVSDHINWLDSRSGSNNNSRLMYPDLNSMSMSSPWCRQHDQVMLQENSSDHVLLNRTQPTMRLMGKDVAIGKSSENVLGFEDGKVWTDKEIVAEHHNSICGLDSNSGKSHFHNFQQDWILHSPLGVQRNQAPQSSLLMANPPASRFSHPYLNLHTNLAFQHGTVPSSSNHSSTFHPFTHPSPTSRAFSGSNNFLEPIISGFEYLEPRPQHMGVSPKHNSFPVTKSAFNFPFLHPDSREQVQARESWFESSSKTLPPWLLDATTQQKGPMLTSTISNQPIHHPPIVSYPHPLVPIHPGIKPPNPAINTSYRNRNKVKERLSSKSFGIRDPDFCKKPKKRVSDTVNTSPKPTKMRFLDMQEDSGLMREGFCSRMQCNAVAGSSDVQEDLARLKRAFELDSSRDIGSRVGCNVHDQAHVESCCLERSSGPIKLTAGAKHILKPIDEDMNSRLIHSTFPYVPATSSSRAMELQKKTAKVYRF